MARTYKPKPPQPDIRRIVTLLDWVGHHGPTSVEALCDRFGWSEAEVRSDVDAAVMIGVPPYTGDCLVDAWVDDDGTVYVDPIPELTQPMSLSDREALSLVVAASLLAAVTDVPALETGRHKIEDAIGASGRVHVADHRPPLLANVQQAIDARERMVIDYRPVNRPAGTRTIEPFLIFVDGGRHYAAAVDVHASSADNIVQKRYRIDRIAAVLDTAPARFPTPDTEKVVFTPHDQSTPVRIRLPKGQHWPVERFPADDVVRRDDGTVDATFVVSDPDWLARIILRTGATILSPDDWGGHVEAFATRIRNLYS